MKKRWICMVCALLFCLPHLCALSEVPVHFNETPPEDWQERDLLRLTVFKTMVNDAMLLQCDGDAMLVDGAMDKWAQLLLDAFTEMGLTAEDGHVHIPHVFNTHPHEDHLKGIYRMIRRGLTTDEFITSFPDTYKNSMLRTALKEFRSRDIPIHQPEPVDQYRSFASQHQPMTAVSPSSSFLASRVSKAAFMLSGPVMEAGSMPAFSRMEAL